jgi:phospholipase C
MPCVLPRSRTRHRLRGVTFIAVTAAGCGDPTRVPADDAVAAVDAPVVADARLPIPIEHVVVVVKENHTFDNYFGSFPGADGVDQILTADGWIAPPPDGLGFRVPLIIISPYARQGFVFHELAEQASIPRFIERVFGAAETLADRDPAARDGDANDLFGAFDFTQSPLPPLTLQARICL